MSTHQHTPGSLRVIPHEKKPWVLQTIDNDGNVVYERFLPYFSAKDKTFNDVMNCANFPAPCSKEATPTYNSDYCSGLNQRAYADEILRAAAPEMLEALEYVYQSASSDSPDMWKKVRTAIAKAKGE